MARDRHLPPKLTAGGFSLLSSLMQAGYKKRIAINPFDKSKFTDHSSGDTVNAACVQKLVLDGYLIPSPAQNPLFYDLSQQALDLACPNCHGGGMVSSSEANGSYADAVCSQCSGRRILAPGTHHTPPFKSKPKSATTRRRFTSPKLDRTKPPSTLGAALDTLLNMPVASSRRDLTPAKPGYYWAAFDNGRSFDPADWYGMPNIGPGPHILKVSQDPDYGEWSATLRDGGYVDLGEDIANRRVRLSFPVETSFIQSVAMEYLRITWLGPVVSPGLPEEVEPFPEWL